MPSRHSIPSLSLEALSMSDKNIAPAITEIEVAKMSPAERRRYEAEVERFPNLSQRVQAKLHMLNDSQLEQQFDFILDYPDQESFEAAILALHEL